MNEIIHDGITFQILSEHPHQGELCHLVGETKNTITELEGIGFKVKLLNCKHLIDFCYVDRHHLHKLNIIKEKGGKDEDTKNS